MQLEEMRMNRKMGEDDPHFAPISRRHASSLNRSLPHPTPACRPVDTLGRGHRQRCRRQPEKTKIKDEMVALLDRRRYIRNLVRDVNEALES